jgi:Mrp family chromosome partitioning ATPase
MEYSSTVLNLAAAKSEKSDNGRLPNAGHDAEVARAQESASALVPSPPVHKLAASRRERERILPSGAGGPFGDAYKMLRTQVLKRLDQINANTLAILSPSAGDGKTSTAINLAIAIAAERSRYVLLVDFDFRNPSLHRRFGLKAQVGIDECLQSGDPIHTAMVKIAGYDRLTLLPARNRVEHSSELLAEARTAEAVAEMRGRYVNRIVIFDLPPILASDDALAFSRLVQAGLIVVCEGHTRREDVTRSIGLLNELPIVGTALNASREPSGAAY